MTSTSEEEKRSDGSGSKQSSVGPEEGSSDAAAAILQGKTATDADYETDSEFEGADSDDSWGIEEEGSENDDDYERLPPIHRIQKAIRNDKKTALIMALDAAKVENIDEYDVKFLKMNPLELSCYYGSMDCVQYLITDRKASIFGSGRAFAGSGFLDLPHPTSHIPPVHIAFITGMCHVLYYLIDYASAKGILADVLGAPPNAHAGHPTILHYMKGCASGPAREDILRMYNSLPNLSKNKSLQEATNDAEPNLSKKPKLEVSSRAKC